MLTDAKLRDTRIFIKTANVMIRDGIMANHRRDLAIKEATLVFGVPKLVSLDISYKQKQRRNAKLADTLRRVSDRA